MSDYGFTDLQINFDMVNFFQNKTFAYVLHGIDAIQCQNNSPKQSK